MMDKKLARIQAQTNMLWHTICLQKGYNEWINADIACFLVRAQMEDIIKLQTDEFTSQLDRKTCRQGLDQLFAKMSSCMQQHQHHQQQHTLYFHYTILYNNLLRILYIVK